MKRIAPVTIVAVLALATLVPAAQATQGFAPERLPTGHPVADHPTGPPRYEVPSSPLDFTAAGSLSGHVYNYDGSAMANATVNWYDKPAADWNFGGSVTADGNGSYAVPAVTGTTTGALEVIYPEGSLDADFWQAGVTFPDPGAGVVDLQPGRVTWTTNRDPDWGDWDSPAVTIEDAGDSGSYQWYSGTTGTPVTRTCEAAVGSADYGYIQYWSNEADEADFGPSAVTAGATAAGTVTFDETTALRTWRASPYWPSTKPGGSVVIAIDNWPAGYVAGFDGIGDWPNGSWTDFGGRTLTSTGTDPQFARFRIPGTARAGYGYIIGAYRPDVPGSDMWVNDYFQLATIKASKDTTSPRGAVKISGVVPTEFHWGATAGSRKPVVIYRRTSSAGIPTSWDPRGKDWRRVATVRCTGYGKYHAYLHPTRTAWYVARYAEDLWYWGAFTNVIKVTVR